MTDQDPNVPPAGEEIHLPPGSLQPLAVAAGLTIFLVSLTTWPAVSVVGAIILIVAIGLWIRDARREYVSLPEHHGDDHGHASAPVAQSAAKADAAKADAAKADAE